MNHWHARFRAVLVLAVLAALALVASLAHAASPVTVVKVTIGDASTTFSPRSPPPVAIRFAIKNMGKKSHALVISRKISPTIGPGLTGRLDVGFTKGGKYAFRVTNGGKGGTLVIKASSSTPPSGNPAQL